jgi:acetyl esterase/lipase
MAPSEESRALSKLFALIKEKSPSDPYLARVLYDQVHTVATEARGVSYESVTVSGRPGIWILPAEASSKHVILFMHGGGYTMGSPWGHRKLAAHLAKEAKCVALSIDYRKTPEHPYPAPLDDCVAAYEWLLAQNFPAGNIVTAGDSCGGGLATTVILAAVKKGLPMPAAAAALSPWYDKGLSGASMTSNAEVDVLAAPGAMDTLVSRYTGGKADIKDPLISPIYADLKGLPPHWISCGGDDTLRDQGVEFAEKAKKAGVEVVLRVAEGQQHVFEFMVGNAPESTESVANIGKWIQEKIGSGA